MKCHYLLLVSVLTGCALCCSQEEQNQSVSSMAEDAKSVETCARLERKIDELADSVYDVLADLYKQLNTIRVQIDTLEHANKD